MRAVVLLFLAACATPSSPPPKIEMVKMDPPTDPTETTTTDVDAGKDPHQVELAVGGIATFPADSVKSYSAANDKIDVRLTPDGKTFVIAGKSKGRCDLLLIHKDNSQEIFNVEVLDQH